MDPWVTLVRMVDEGRLATTALEDVRRLIGSACVAQVDQPRSMVSAAVLDHLERGASLTVAVAAVEELVAIRHNRMLIAAGRRGVDDAESSFFSGRRRRASVLTFPSPTFAA